MNHSGPQRPPDGIDMFINDRRQQMEKEAVKTTYCKRQGMAEWSRWREWLRGERGDFRVKKIKVYVQRRGNVEGQATNLFKSRAITGPGERRPRGTKLYSTRCCFFLQKSVVFCATWKHFIKKEKSILLNSLLKNKMPLELSVREKRRWSKFGAASFTKKGTLAFIFPLKLKYLTFAYSLLIPVFPSESSHRVLSPFFHPVCVWWHTHTSGT